MSKKKRLFWSSKTIFFNWKKIKSKPKKQRNGIIGGGIILTILSVFGVQFNKVRRERNDKIAFAEALIFAQENERKRIARNLHDGVGQSLLLLKKQMEYSVENTLENQEMIAETLEEVRTISRDLHPFQLEKFGLTAAITETIQKVANSSEVFVSKEIENIDELVPKSSQIHIFRTVQEALNNVVKHSEATAVKVSIQIDEQEVLIQIMDNGKGFDYELAMVKQKSLGLKTMFERIAAIGGKLTIRPGEAKGTVVEVRLGKGGE
jgi:signal transduction histidine kinase